MMCKWPFISAFTVAIADAMSYKARQMNRPGPDFTVYEVISYTWEWQSVSGLYEGLYKLQCWIMWRVTTLIYVRII